MLLLILLSDWRGQACLHWSQIRFTNQLPCFPLLKFHPVSKNSSTTAPLCYCHGDAQALRWCRIIMWQGNSCNPVTARGKRWCRKSWLTVPVSYWLPRRIPAERAVTSDSTRRGPASEWSEHKAWLYITGVFIRGWGSSQVPRVWNGNSFMATCAVTDTQVMSWI